MTEQPYTELEKTAMRVRETVIRLATGGGCFLGASLSAVEILVYLYRYWLHLPNPRDPERDYFFLSKGHDVPALYGVLAERGWLEKSRLRNHLKPHDAIYWHPNRAVPGVEFHSGSLGHLLSVAVGVAWDLKQSQAKNRVVVLVGDGELNEGSNWEALLIAQAYQLSQLTVVVDRNQFQANARTEELIPLEPLEAKFAAFGASPLRVDGHDFASLDRAFARLPLSTRGPSVIIADTVRGKGLPSIEARVDRWFCNFTPSEVESLIRELHGDTETRLQSPAEVVR